MKPQKDKLAYYRSLDDILKQLNKDLVTRTETSAHMVDVSFLFSRGLIMSDGIYSDRFNKITLTKEGMVFISEGGFEEEYQQKLKKIYHDKVTANRAKIALFISILLAIIQLLTFIYKFLL